jgi:hypothetical protein
MPDGFDPHVELERIYTYRDYVLGCRQRTAKCLTIIDDFLDDEEQAKVEKVKVAFQLLDRGHGKPRQTVVYQDDSNVKTQRLVVLPDNNRDDLPPMTIEGESNAG